MRVRIEIDDDLIEEEIIIRCRSIDNTIREVQEAISGIMKSIPKLEFFKEDKEFYLELDSILFFETSDNRVDAHTMGEVYQVRYRLYELEEMLPSKFIRISKSTILNIDKVLSITRNLTSFNLVEFYKTHKQVYVSRFYYKNLRQALIERRNYEKK